MAAHLLGNDLSRLSRSRDGLASAGPVADQTLGEFLARWNDTWVAAAARISPAVLVSLLETSSAQVLAFWRSRDLAAFGERVSWSGPEPAPVWLDCARELTEDWIHQRQIREATGRVTDQPDVLRMVLSTFVRAVPYTLGRLAPDVADGASVTLIAADPDASWSWLRTGRGWLWAVRPADQPTSTVRVGADTLWRVAVRMIEPEQAWASAHIDGDAELGRATLQLVSIIR